MKKLLLFLLLVTSCKHAQWPAKVAVDPAYEDQVQESLIALGGKFTPDILNSEDTSHFQIFITVFPLDDTILGMASPGDKSCEIVLNTNIFHEYRSMQKSVIWHEVGHCVGLEHSDNRHDVMYYAASDFDEYSPDDIQRFINDFNLKLRVQKDEMRNSLHCKLKLRK